MCRPRPPATTPAARDKSWCHLLSIIRGRRRSSSLSDGVDSSGGELVKLYPAHAQTTLYCVTQPAFCMLGKLRWSVNSRLSHDDDQLRIKMSFTSILLISAIPGIATFDVATQRTCSAGCKRWAILQKSGLQLPRESNGGVYGRWPPTHITNSAYELFLKCVLFRCFNTKNVFKNICFKISSHLY